MWDIPLPPNHHFVLEYSIYMPWPSSEHEDQYLFWWNHEQVLATERGVEERAGLLGVADTPMQEHLGRREPEPTGVSQHAGRPLVGRPHAVPIHGAIL